MSRNKKRTRTPNKPSKRADRPRAVATAQSHDVLLKTASPDASAYQEASFGVAVALRLSDRHEKAAEEFQNLLRLDSGDRQFARYWLAACLLDLERHDQLGELLARHDEATDIWRYAQSLLAFRRGGDDDEARQLLREARELDASFLDYLLGDAVVDAQREVRFDVSPKERAHSCARLFLPAWRSTPGAATWVRRALRVPMQRPVAAELPFPHDELRRLPQRPVTWQLGLRLLEDGDSGKEPVWLLAIGNVDERQMPLMTVLEEEPTPQRVWREVLAALQRPMEGEPQRPQRLDVPREHYFHAWRRMLDDISMECVYEQDPQPIGQLTAAMVEVVKHQRSPQLDDSLNPLDFPQTNSVWQADFHHASLWISNDQVGVERPWIVIVMDKASGFVLANELLPGAPTPELMWEYLLRTMAHPGIASAFRPAAIEVSDSDTYDLLKPKLANYGIQCRLLDELAELDNFCDELAGGLDSSEKCSLADGKGVTAEQMELFYHAAACYFAAAPWKHVPGEIPIRVGCRGLDTGTRYAVVLGRTGVQLGLAVYDDWDSVESVLQGWTSPDELAALTVLFDEATIMSGKDLRLVERNGWPIASPEGYPVALRIDGQRTRPPTAEELKLLMGCLRVLPDFVRQQRDAKSYQVEADRKQFKLRFTVGP